VAVPRADAQRTYDPRVAAEIVPYLAAGLLVAFAGLWPAARLSAVGASRSIVVGYYGLIVGLALALVFVRAGLRVVAPILAIAYVLPFVLARLRPQVRR
jgi:hypothetical protein